MGFERKSMEALVYQMIGWSRGVSTKISDFRVGNRARTMYEAIALVVEENYDRMHHAVKDLIESNIYTVLGFPKRPALHATGTVTFGRETAADGSYVIPLGTVVKTKETDSQMGVCFRTTQEVVLREGERKVEVPIICKSTGAIGNTDAGTIVEFETKPAGIETVYNAHPLSNGLEEETRDEQKNRFQKFISSLSRGTLPAIEYGATTAKLVSTEGAIIERVSDAKTFEDTINKLGEVDCYIWNGVGKASTELLAQVEKILCGYYDSKGKPIYGYKPAGIKVNLHSATTKWVKVKLHITPSLGISLADIRTYVEREIGDFFQSLRLGQTLVQTALETRVKLVDGVYDVKIKLSIDNGVTYAEDNLASNSTEIFIPVHPYVYE